MVYNKRFDYTSEHTEHARRMDVVQLQQQQQQHQHQERQRSRKKTPFP